MDSNSLVSFSLSVTLLSAGMSFYFYMLGVFLLQ